MWRVAIPAAAAAAALAIGLSEFGSPQQAQAATPPMLMFSAADAPAIGTLLPELAARSSRLPDLTAPAHGYLYQRTESWNLAVSVARSSVSAQVIPVVYETWATSRGPQLQLEHQAPSLAPGQLTEREESRARDGVTVGPGSQVPIPRSPFTTTRGLSGQPEMLFRQLATAIPGSGAVVTSQLDVGHAMQNLQTYLGYSVPEPKLLSATYRMLSRIPGVTDAGWVTDRAGRHGLAIAVPVGGRHFEDSFRLIVDPETGVLLDVEEIQQHASALSIRTPFVFQYEIFLRPALVRHTGTR